MGLRFTVLASGSAGNASLLEAGGLGVLIDAGLGPRLLTSRLESVGAGWDNIRVVLLTHTHTDHWKQSTLTHLLRRRIYLYCHPGHLANVQAAGLLREVRRQSMPGRLRHVVQLHLSRDCNHPSLAAEAARAVLAGDKEPAEVHTARQDRPGPSLNLVGGTISPN